MRRGNETFLGTGDFRKEIKQKRFTTLTRITVNGARTSGQIVKRLFGLFALPRRTSRGALLRSRTGLLPKFDGTFGSLIDCYFTDPASPFVKRTIEYATRQNYISLCRPIRAELGDIEIRDFTGRDLQDWADIRINKGQIPMAHSLVGMLSTLCSFGGSMLNSQACRDLSAMRSKMRFPMGKARTARLTPEQVEAHRTEAHLQGYGSIAFADSLQFEGILRQKDAIGAWVPLDEAERSDVIADGEKSIRGARWDEIDDNLVLHHLTSKKKKTSNISLRDAPMVMEELRKIAKIGPDVELTRDMLPATGPLIVCEETGLPWQSYEFRRRWRQVSNVVGIPKNVFSMDQRASGISEAIDAGVPADHVRQAANHAQFTTTARYIRNQEFAATSTLQGRAKHRAARAATLVPKLPTTRAKPSTARRKASPQARRAKQSPELSNAKQTTA